MYGESWVIISSLVISECGKISCYNQVNQIKIKAKFSAHMFSTMVSHTALLD